MGDRTFLGQVMQTFGIRIAGIVLAVPTSVFLARGLIPNARGEYALILTSVAVASLFTSMGLAPANARFAAKHPEYRGALLGNSLFYSLTVGIVAFLVLLPLKGIFSLTLFSSAVIGALVSLTLFSGYAANILLGAQLITRYNIAQAIEYISRFTAFLVVWLLSPGIWEFIFAFTASIALKCAYVMLELRKVVRTSRPSGSLLMKQVKFGLPLHLSTVLRRLNTSITIYLLRIFSDDAAVGYFSIPQNYLVRAKILPRTIAALLLPRVASREDGTLMNQTARLLRVMFFTFILVTAVFFFIIPPLFGILYGPDYAPAVPAARIIIFAFPLFSFSQVSANYLIGGGNTKFFLRLSAYSFGTGLATLLVCVPKWGLKGAALAVVTMELTSFLYCLVTMRRLGGFSFRQILLPVRDDPRFLMVRIGAILRKSRAHRKRENL